MKILTSISDIVWGWPLIILLFGHSLGGLILSYAAAWVLGEGGRALSFAQERLWFLQQLEPDDVSYLAPEAIRVQGSQPRLR